MILLIDNYDSFVHNLARYFQRLGQTTVVLRNDDVDARRVRDLAPRAVVLSPGPCTPREAGRCLPLVEELQAEFPMLGVCLGHQIIAAALGGRIVRATEPMHGRSSAITHTEDGLFQGVPSPLQVCRYHSLVVDPRSLPRELDVTARTEDRVIMAFQHRRLPLIGVQFHPESVLTERGYALAANFLRIAIGDAYQPSADLPDEGFTVGGSPSPPLGNAPLPKEPLTF